MKTCARCGAQNPDDAVFCANCGYGFEQPAGSATAPSGPPPPPYQGPPPPYAPPPAGYPPGPPMAGGPHQYSYAPHSNGKATAALVLGIIGIFVCPIICSVLAIIFGYSAKSEIAASRGAQSGDSNATAGIILGWLGLAIHVIWLTIVIIAITVHAHSLILLF